MQKIAEQLNLEGILMLNHFYWQTRSDLILITVAVLFRYFT